MVSQILSWEVSHNKDDGIIIKFHGAITETADFSGLLAQVKGTVRIDLENIEWVNSVGVQKWVTFIHNLCMNHEVILERCGEMMVGQMNMIANLNGTAIVSSVMLPYYCLNCNNEEKILLDLAKGKVPIKQKVTCRLCNGTMEFDGSANKYLDFMTELKPTEPHARPSLPS